MRFRPFALLCLLVVPPALAHPGHADSYGPRPVLPQPTVIPDTYGAVVLALRAWAADTDTTLAVSNIADLRVLGQAAEPAQ